MKIRNSIPALLLALPLASQAWFMPYPKPAGKYPQASAADSAAAHSKLQTLWNSWKGSYGGSKVPNNVSEGSGYGMLMAVMMNDRAGFLQLWQAAESQLWLSKDGSPSDGWYAWKPSPTTEGMAQAASDADEDIALALIFASALVKAGYWQPMSVTFSYYLFDKATGRTGGAIGPVTISVETRAAQILYGVERYMTSGVQTAFNKKHHFTHASMEYQLKDASGNAVTLYNPSYFSPAWYRVYEDFNATMKRSSEANWPQVIENGYTMIQSQPSANKGLVRDWSNEIGAKVKMDFFTGELFGHVDEMYYDGIRAPYRLGVDAIWWGDANAKTYVANAAATAASPSLWRNLDGGATGWQNGSENMALAMWGAAAAGGAAVGNATAKTSLSSNWTNWMSKNEGDYFKGALYILGGLVMSGNFPNVWADLKSEFKNTDTSTKITTALKALPDSIDAGGSTRLTATASKAVKWRIKYKAQSTGAAGTWTLMVGAATKTTMDTTFTFKNATLVGQVYDVKAYWDGGTDTSRTTIKVKGTSSVLRSIRQDLVIRAGKQLSIQVPGAFASSVQVRILDLSGRETRSFQATPNQGRVEISMDNLGRGTQMIEIIDGTTVHRGLVPVIR